jgi:hypothetical protein
VAVITASVGYDEAALALLPSVDILRILVFAQTPNSKAFACPDALNKAFGDIKHRHSLLAFAY